MGDHSGHLAKVFGGQKEARVQEHVEAASDESVERIVVDQVDVDGLWGQPGLLEERRGDDTDGLFDLCVADKGQALLRLSGRGQANAKEKGENGRDEKRFTQNRILTSTAER